MPYFIGFAGFAKTKRYVVGRIVGTLFTSYNKSSLFLYISLLIRALLKWLL
jgi:cell division protein FtsL